MVKYHLPTALFNLAYSLGLTIHSIQPKLDLATAVNFRTSTPRP